MVGTMNFHFLIQDEGENFMTVVTVLMSLKGASQTKSAEAPKILSCSEDFKITHSIFARDGLQCYIYRVSPRTLSPLPGPWLSSPHPTCPCGCHG